MKQIEGGVMEFECIKCKSWPCRCKFYVGIFGQLVPAEKQKLSEETRYRRLVRKLRLEHEKSEDRNNEDV